MGTNYYARIITTRERKEKIKQAIDNNDFDEIMSLVSMTYSTTNYYYGDNGGSFAGGEIHLGKRSGGWKFLWNPNWYKQVKGRYENGQYIDDGFDVFRYYDLTKESLKKFIDREDVIIYDEYGDKQDKEEFWNMALNWGYNKDEEEGWDGEAYEEWEMKQNPNYKPIRHETDYSKFIEQCGFKTNKYKTDFYSDGLRFATCTDFS